MAPECLALNTLIFIFAGLQNQMDLLQIGQRLDTVVDTVEGKSYKHFFIMCYNGFN